MIDAALIKSAMSGIGGGLGSGAALLLVGGMVMFPSKDVYEAHEAEFHVHTATEEASDLRRQIADDSDRAATEQPGEYKTSLCRSLEQAIGRLCEIAPMDAMCLDRDVYRRRAGCG